MARIMICDDAAFMLKSLSLSVSKMGHEVVAETEDGQDAVKAYIKEKPDLVLMDISMPVKDGIETLKEIMKEAYRQLPRCFYMARDATGKINLNDLIEGTNVVMEMDA